MKLLMLLSLAIFAWSDLVEISQHFGKNCKAFGNFCGSI